jgi:hypothetical protein
LSSVFFHQKHILVLSQHWSLEGYRQLCCSNVWCDEVWVRDDL